MFDYHMHSDFSADCKTPMEKTIEKAIETGLKEICFTDHIDYDYPDKDFIFEFNMNDYDKKIKDMQDIYGEQITIKKGVEIGVQPHILSQYETLMKEEKFDFVICSLHSVEKKDMHFGQFFEGKTVDEAHRIYYEELLECIKAYKGFNVLGHLDLVKRYSKEKSNDQYHDLIQEIFTEIIPAGKGIEINTSGYGYGLESAMPSLDILKLFKESGGEIVTIGSDAHVPDKLGQNFKAGLEQLKDVGFKYVATFTGGKPEFHPIEQLQWKK